MVNFVDLFCGAGGFSLGFKNAGFKNIFSLDINEDFCTTYKFNFPNDVLIQKDIYFLTRNDIVKIVPNNVDVVIGGPPCQGFSIAGNIGRKFLEDPRNNLFKEFAKVISTIQPKVFVMENVARLFTHNSGHTKNEIISTFKNLGYDVDCKLLNTNDYGVPQKRKRIIFIGNRIGVKNIFPKSDENKVLIKNAIDDLPKLKSGGCSSIPNHVAMNHSDQMLKKMSFIKDGGNRYQIPRSLRPKSGDVRKYIKYDSTMPSICITGDMRKVFHYNQNRALTVRELARIQTFPDTFIFKGSRISQQQQVGNAVPPLFAKKIAKNIKKMLML